MNCSAFDFNTVSNQIVDAWKYAKSYSYKCCCPTCNNKAIKSHLLQQHPILESICDEKNALLQMVNNCKDPRSGDWNFYQRHNVGISEALQFKLFCHAHDNGLYSDLEARNSVPASKQDCLLLAFRSACAVRHQEEQRLHINEKLQMSSGFKDDREAVSRLSICRMDAVVNNLWDAINGKGDNYYLFRMISIPRIEIVVSDCIIDEDDLEKHIMDNGYNAPLNCLFINLILSSERLLLLLGCDTRYDKEGEFQNIIKDFPIGDVTFEYYLGTIKGILLKCRNWCCAPRLYDDSDWRTFFDEYEELSIKSSVLSGKIRESH